MPPLIVAALNRKGGVGKTSLTYHLAGAFARQGRRVLLLDCDSQASLSQGFYGPDGVESLPRDRTLFALFDDRADPDPGKLIRPAGFPGISLVPGSFDLDRFNDPEPHTAGPLQFGVRQFVKEAGGDFDVVLCDCPPTLGLLSWAAVVAAGLLLVPTMAEDFGSQGLPHVQRFADVALAGANPGLRLAGYVLTMFNPRLVVHSAYAGQLRQLYQDDVLAATMPLATHYKEAVAARQPVAFYKPKSAAAKAVDAIAGELVARAERLRGEGARFLHLENRVSRQRAEGRVA